MSMPDEFELPSPKDFCRGNFTKGERHCFVGWQRELLPLSDIWVMGHIGEIEELRRFFKTALKVAIRLKLKARLKTCFKSNDRSSYTCFDYNDDTRNTPTQLAKWFEETVKEFGYDVK